MVIIMKDGKKLLTITLTIMLMLTAVSFAAQAGSIKKTSRDTEDPVAELSLPSQRVPRFRLQIQAPSEVDEGESFQVFVTNGGIPVENAVIELEWMPFPPYIYLTDVDGSIILTAPEVDYTRSYNITASKTGYFSSTVSIIVINILPQLVISAPSEVDEGENFEVFVTTSYGVPVGNAMVIPEWNGESYYTDMNGTVWLTAPEVLNDTVFVINVSKLGYISNWTLITVLNQPEQLVIHAPSEVDENEMFAVLVSADNQSIPGASVAFNGETKQTNFNGTVTFIAPEVNYSMNFSIFAYKYGYLNETAQIYVMNTPQLVIHAPDAVMENTVFLVVIMIKGTNYTVANASVNVEWSNVTYYTDPDGIVYLTAPDVIQDTNFTIGAGKSGYLPTEVWITVIDYPPEAPNTPTIDGPTYGYLGVNITFTIVTTDPDPGDSIYYRIDWDDNTPLEWFGPYSSGEVVEVIHKWTTTGPQYIVAQAKDSFGCESGWSDPYNITIYDPYDVPHYAVVIGEWNYPGIENDTAESLWDAHSINTFLEDTNEWTNIEYHTNHGADGIMSELTWMKDQENEGSISLFYYSGHGIQILDDNGDEADGLDEALYCTDGNTIRDDDLSDLLAQFEGPVVVILESSYSGGFGEIEGDNIVIMAACNETEESHIGGGVMSVFTNYIRIGWNGEADEDGDDKMTDEETFIYARDNTLNYAQGQPWTQTPMLFDGYSGEIPLIISGF